MILAGSDKAFSVGADIKEMMADGLQALTTREREQGGVAIEKFSKPIIAAIGCPSPGTTPMHVPITVDLPIVRRLCFNSARRRRSPTNSVTRPPDTSPSLTALNISGNANSPIKIGIK